MSGKNRNKMLKALGINLGRAIANPGKASAPPRPCPLRLTPDDVAETMS